jgi:hypothetical protein
MVGGAPARLGMQKPGQIVTGLLQGGSARLLSLGEHPVESHSDSDSGTHCGSWARNGVHDYCCQDGGEEYEPPSQRQPDRRVFGLRVPVRLVPGSAK